MMLSKKILTFVLLLLTEIVLTNSAIEAQTQGQQAPRQPDPAWNFEVDPKLPNVLLLGDSISMGYTLDVRTRLKGKANVFRPMRREGIPENTLFTAHGLEHLDKYLGDIKWTVIYFNWGLHDLTYLDASGDRPVPNKETGKLRYSDEEYGKNLEKIVKRLKETGAKLVWASSTVVPEGERGRKSEDVPRYNAIAAKIAKENNIPTDDLYALTKEFKPELFLKPKNVHYTQEGYALLGEHIANTILEKIKSEPQR